MNSNIDSHMISNTNNTTIAKGTISNPDIS